MRQPIIRLLRADPGPPGRGALFVDRDGVLNRRIVDGYVLAADEIQLLPAVLPSLDAARQAGAAIVVVSNQGAISRRLLSEAALLAVHGALVAALADRHARVDATYICPHHPLAVELDDRHCQCRKPAPGLLLAAAHDLGLDLGRSVLIGDQPSDVAAGGAAGIPAERTFCFDAAAATDDDAARLAGAVTRLLG